MKPTEQDFNSPLQGMNKQTLPGTNTSPRRSRASRSWLDNMLQFSRKNSEAVNTGKKSRNYGDIFPTYENGLPPR